MPLGLKNSFQIARLAADLGLGHRSDPVAAILAFCHRRINDILRKFGCDTLSALMSATAGTLDTLFVEIHDDVDLDGVRSDYLARGELIFATLAEQLGPHVYAITFKVTRPREGDRRFVSVIDCRGAKAARNYFSKWHELVSCVRSCFAVAGACDTAARAPFACRYGPIRYRVTLGLLRTDLQFGTLAHLLTLTSQARLKFCRTHTEPDDKDPEEALMDVIAGEVGFCPELVRPHATGEISFDRIADLRDQLCPDASEQASLIGLIKSWPAPCVLVQARPGLKAHERRSLAQGRFPFHDGPEAVLRAVNVTVSSAAERAGMTIHRNMRIPDESVITRVFKNSVTSLEAEEDLAWWTSSSGRGLTPRPVTVRARRHWDAAEAMIVPARNSRLRRE